MAQDDGTVLVQLFPGTNIHIEIARGAAQHLVNLLRRYNWTLSEPRQQDARWRRFWRGITQAERTMS
jgi:hypothetical protein